VALYAFYQLITDAFAAMLWGDNYFSAGPFYLIG
jgi:hypothetical protein